MEVGGAGGRDPPGRNQRRRDDATHLEEREVLLRSLEAALEARSRAIDARESAVRKREEIASQREDAHHLVDQAMTQLAAQNEDLLSANQKLVMATLAAQELREAAQLARRRQDEFLAMLAHELRNPLAPISSVVEVLAKLDGQPIPPKMIEIARRQITHLVRLVDDLLDVSRVTEGKVLLQRRRTEVADFVQQAIETCRSDLVARQHRFTAEFDPESLFVDGDQVRLTQIITNLLQNAARYTPDGGEISVQARRQGDQVEIRVRDNGAGITAEALPHVFDLFVQDERPLSRAEGGLGIGLTVVRRMVEMHGGTVQAFSEGRDRGSEFIVRLPAIQAPGFPKLAPPAAAALAPVAARILIVEDNVDAGNALAELLRLSGHKVEIALDGPSGLKRFEECRPQVVVCDIGLPGLDGYEVVTRMRQSRHDPRPALIALSGYGGPTYADRALQAGFDHHIVKPVNPEEILRLIDAAMRLEDWTVTSHGQLTSGFGGLREDERRRGP